MRCRIFAVVLVAASAIGCAAGERPPTPPLPHVDAKYMEDAQVEVGRVLDAWHAAAARADEEAYFGAFGFGAVFLGTDATERWDVNAFRTYAHPHFAKGKAWSFKATRRAVTVDNRGEVAWFDEDLATPNLGPARGSGVMHRLGSGAWMIVQYNLAITVPNERFKAVKDLLAQ